MEPLKKKLFGYDAEIVDATIKELNDEVFSLRQELFNAEKEDLDRNVYDTEHKEENAALIQELNSHKKTILEKNETITKLQLELTERKNEIFKLTNELAILKEQKPVLSTKPGKILNEQAVRDAITAYKNAIATKDDELKSLKTQNSSLLEKVLMLENENKKIKSQATVSPKRNVPDMKLIENVYMRAFNGAKAIADDARDSIGNLTDRVFLELSGDISNTARLHEELLATKNEVISFINLGVASFKNLEKLTQSVSDVDINTADYIKKLSVSRNKIIAEVNEAVSAFDIDSFAAKNESDNIYTSTNNEEQSSLFVDAENNVNSYELPSTPNVDNEYGEEKKSEYADDSVKTNTPDIKTAENISFDISENLDMPSIDVDFSIDSLFIDVPSVEEAKIEEPAPIEGIANPDYQVAFPSAPIQNDSNATQIPQANNAQTEFNIENETNYSINLAPIEAPEAVSRDVSVEESLIDLSDNDSNSDIYSPDDELNEMKLAIKRSIEDKKKKEEEEATQKGAAEKEATQNSTHVDAPVRPKINVQDILKKYSNLS